ncbi:hypothetical protein [Pantanalinema sp. GBBB05]
MIALYFDNLCQRLITPQEDCINAAQAKLRRNWFTIVYGQDTADVSSTI